MPFPSTRKASGYLPGLDGLRACAIIGVLLTHDLPWSIAGHSDAAWKGLGGWGVQLFFAISGVLICWRLLEEQDRAGTIHLGSFYLRRLFRIQPAALCYLATVAVLFFLGVVATDWHLWFAAALSYINFLVTASTPPGTAAFLGHFWTLAVEEHFYILLSLFLVTFHERRVLLLTIFIIILLAAQQFGADHGEFHGELSIRRTYWVIQLLLVPALFALLIRIPKIRRLAGRFLKPWVATVITLLMMLGHQWSERPEVLLAGWAPFSAIDFLVLNQTYLFYGFSFLVVAVMLSPRSLSTRFLELPPIRFVGRLSYSIYLWHVLFFIPIYLGNLIHSPFLIVLSGRPWKYIATAFAALLSYFLIEKPLIRLGHRLAPPATQGHPDLQQSPSHEAIELAANIPN